MLSTPHSLNQNLVARVPFDTRAFRSTLGAFPTGVAVVTARSRDGRPIGITINSFASVSLDPPLILWSQALVSPTHDEYSAADTLIINILAETQRDISTHFARPQDDKFSGIDWDIAPCGTPRLAGCAATLYCRRSRRYEGGDHTIHLCEVNTFESHDRAPLIFCRGRYVDQAQTSIVL